MPVIDASGRLFGRWNIVDTAVVLVILLLIPLGYGAYLLFRPPEARLVAVDPAQVTVGTTQVTVKGEHLRPTFRMTIGTLGTTFLYANPNGGVLQVPPLPPGTYDVVLLDEELEIGRLPGALVVQDRKADAALLAVGAFVPLESAQAGIVSSELEALLGQPAPWGEVLGFLPPEPNTQMLPPGTVPVIDGRYRINAVLRLPCVLSGRACRVQDVALVPGAALPLPVKSGIVTFEIEELHPPYADTLEIVMRGSLAPEESALLRTWEPAAETSFPARDALLPTLVSVSPLYETQDRQQIANVRFRVPARATPEGWVYRGQVLRVGARFVLVRGSQQLRGRIISLAPQRRPGENGAQ